AERYRLAAILGCRLLECGGHRGCATDPATLQYHWSGSIYKSQTEKNLLLGAKLQTDEVLSRGTDLQITQKKTRLGAQLQITKKERRRGRTNLQQVTETMSTLLGTG
ncbi:unnamed protein product, partial [Amoebophrya sp. A25]